MKLKLKEGSLSQNTNVNRELSLPSWYSYRAQVQIGQAIFFLTSFGLAGGFGAQKRSDHGEPESWAASHMWSSHPASAYLDKPGP